MERVASYVREHLEAPIAVADLARLVGRSESCFSRLFREAAGVTPHQFVIRERVRRAAALIGEENGLALSEIAVRCGFADQAHLTRAFKREVGMTPAAYCRERGLPAR